MRESVRDRRVYLLFMLGLVYNQCLLANTRNEELQLRGVSL